MLKKINYIDYTLFTWVNQYVMSPIPCERGCVTRITGLIPIAPFLATLILLSPFSITPWTKVCFSSFNNANSSQIPNTHHTYIYITNGKYPSQVKHFYLDLIFKQIENPQPTLHQRPCKFFR
jgi:hypothetical protein